MDPDNNGVPLPLSPAWQFQEYRPYEPHFEAPPPAYHYEADPYVAPGNYPYYGVPSVSAPVSPHPSQSRTYGHYPQQYGQPYNHQYPRQYGYDATPPRRRKPPPSQHTPQLAPSPAPEPSPPPPAASSTPSVSQPVEGVPDIQAIREEVIRREQEWREALVFMETRSHQIKEKEKEELSKLHKRQLDKWILKLKEKTIENNELREKLNASQNQIDDLKSRQALSINNSARSSAQLADLEKENRLLKEEVQKAKTKKSEYEAQVTALHAEKTQLQNIIEEQKKQHKQKLLELNASERSSNLLLQTAQRQLEESRANEEELQKALEQQRTEHQKALEAAQKSRVVNETSEGASKQLQQQVEDLRRQIQEKNQAIILARTQKQEFEKLLAAEKNKSLFAASETDNIARQLKDMHSENSTLSQEIKNQKTTIHKLEADLRGARHSLEKLEQERLSLHGTVLDRQRQVDALQSQLEKLESRQKVDYTNWSRQKAELERQLQLTLSKDEEIGSKVRTLKLEGEELQKTLNLLKDDQIEMNTQFSRVIQESRSQLLQAVAGTTAQVAAAVAKYKKEAAARRKYFNMVQELKGNIRVFCRVRPVFTSEQNGVSFVPEERGDERTLQLQTTLKGISGETKFQEFEFDRVFVPSTSQEDVYADVSSLVTSTMDGYNVCIFAYGQTGSGKTYTMEGPESNPGVNNRALRDLFRIKEERKAEFDYTITFSMMEIYNEKIRDLLSPNQNPDPWDERVEPKLRQGPRGSIFVEGLVEIPVRDYNEVAAAIKKGNAYRSTGVTNMNEHSSRSHMIVCIRVLGMNNEAGISYQSKLYLIDLAGSERLSRSQAEGERLKEALAINKSLAVLGHVLEALQKQSPHVPYRNSKLTYLLQDSLGGQAKTMMFVNISPALEDAEETSCSLTFAARVRKVELGKASKNVAAAAPSGSGSQVIPPLSSHQLASTPRRLVANASDPSGESSPVPASPNDSSLPSPVKRFPSGSEFAVPRGRPSVGASAGVRKGPTTGPRR